ncbi:translocation/assembly module TamB domain-containing protein [Pareuzebyella sediminis]|uniref:translocation/assembly module TamB domain-containing protein n=1 Tax=Pareuzebyella sediminis TaxID=2607998 RepID=UPI0011EFE6D3|nr:translocation/assembly module TamB domain-containing protein [Pareuzebyella sediminis]
MDTKKRHKIFRRIGRIFLGVLLLFVVVVLFIRSPWGQNLIVSKVTTYVSEKTGTEITIDRLFLTFSGNLQLEGFYLEDLKRDTLVYSKNLEANLALTPIIFGNEINVRSIEWRGLTANISRRENSEHFNFQFLIDAFATQDTLASSSNSGQPMTFTVGRIDFRDFKLSFNDAFVGIDSDIHLGRLDATADVMDLDAMKFILDDFELSNTRFNYRQAKPFVQEEDAEQPPLPFLSVDNFEMKNVEATYTSIPDSTNAAMKIQDFVLELPKADLANNDIVVDFMSLKNSDFALQVAEEGSAKKDTLAVKSFNFEWPEFMIEVAKIDFAGNSFSYKVGSDNAVKEGAFNAKDIAISGLGFLANDLLYEPQKLNLQLEQFVFSEKSGFSLNNTSFDVRLDDSSALISDLSLATKTSFVKGSLGLKYASLNELLKAPEKSQVEVKIPNLSLDIEDFFVFQPELSENEYLKSLAQRPISGRLRANGTLNSMEIPDFKLAWGEQTELLAEGRLGNILQVDSLSFDFNTIRATTTRPDILTFVSEEKLGISVPQTMNLQITANGSINNFDADARLSLPEGKVKMTGSYSKYEEIVFDADLKVDSLQLSKLLQNEQFGDVSFTMDVSGSGTDITTMDASLASNFTQLMFRGYDFSNLEAQGELKEGTGNIDISFKDQNLNFKSVAYMELDSITSVIDLHFNLIGADLYALGITKEEIKAGVKLDANFKGNPDDFSLDALFSEGLAVYNNEQYQMGEIDISSRIGKNISEVKVNSDFLNGGLRSNSSPDKIMASVQKQFKNYFSDSIARDTVTDPVKLQLDFVLDREPILTKVFLRGVERLDSVNIKADFDASSQSLNARLYLPSMTYNGIAIDSLAAEVVGTASELSFSAGWGGLQFNPIDVKRTLFTGNLKNKQLNLDLSSFSEGERLLHVASEMTLEKDTIQLHIDPSELVFNRNEWSIPETNQILIGDKILDFKNIVLSRNSQEMILTNAVSGVDKAHIGATFENFRLQTFLSLLNPDEALASGIVAGKFVMENPFEAAGIIADFKINDIKVLESPLGNLSLDAVSKGLANYDFNLALKDGGIDLDVTGDYMAAQTGARLNLDMDLNKVELQVIEGLSGGAIKESEGYISGNIDISGTTAAPEYQGELKFSEVVFNVATLNNIFKINDETLKIDNSGLYLDDFIINDANNSPFTISGSIRTDELINPKFDLTLNAEEFRVLDSKEEDNELYYGIASVDADLSVGGDLNLPEIEGKVRIRKVTDVTYVVPEAQLDVEERDGVVIFVNREDPDAILTRNDQEESAAILKGYDVSTVLEIAEDAVFHIIIDERTGDNLEVSGEGELDLNMSPNGQINLAGRYELSSGHYETSLYNLVNRRFQIKPGSTITWRGDPMDAALDVTAIYNVETSAAPLMAAVISGQDVGVTGKYQQVLPFLVYLKVEGELLQPKLSFDLDMPEDAQGSLGGAVYGRVQQLNEQEALLNKQVFSLLALNRFFPDSGSDGSNGGAVALARDNVNKVLSGQLNAFSDKVFGNSGFEVDFDLDSFTDYQGDSPQDRTQLNINAKKKLFDNRLIVTAGSAVDVEGSAQSEQGQTPIIGNVSLEYLLTEDGRYRLKGFRKNEYENVIDGQLIVTGLALIFNREFNKFSQLFNPLKEDGSPKDGQEEAEKKKNKEGTVQDQEKN